LDSWPGPSSSPGCRAAFVPWKNGPGTAAQLSNVTDKRFPGNPTESYRTRHALRVVEEVPDWPGHPPEVLQAMLDSLERLRAEGRDLIED
jgi:hypothetical protein